MEAGLDLDTTWFISLDRVRCLEVGGKRGAGIESRVIQGPDGERERSAGARAQTLLRVTRPWID